MSINDYEWIKENEWLEIVMKEARRQLDEKRESSGRLKSENIETQRELWQDVGSISIENNLDQLVDFLAFIDLMKRQKRTYRFTKKLEEKYEKLVFSPYFGRIDFVENGDEKPEKHYIGAANLVNDNYDIMVYDWRAPVSGMFYDYEIGEAGYISPEGVVSGKVTLKRQYKINNGKIEYMFDSNLKIDDEILQEVLSKSTDSRMRTIITSIQREQNQAIRNEMHKNLVVQGPAGSGKTSIALHRVAYLLYKYRDRVTPQNILIFSPNQIFNDYISNVLPQLGEDNMLQTTFKEYMHKALGDEFKKEDYYEMMEYILGSKDKPGYQKRIHNIKFKSSNEFAEMLKEFAACVGAREKSFSDIFFCDKPVISSQELKKLYNSDYSKLPLKKRLQKIRERILFLLKPLEEERMKEVVEELKEAGSYIDETEIRAKGIAYVRDEMKDINAEIDRITKFAPIDIYRQFIEELGNFTGVLKREKSENEVEEIKNYTLENLNARQLFYEDQPPLLYLKGALGDLPKTSEIKYVIIDEAQDYTMLQYEIFCQLFNHASITMLGDLNQSINPYMNIGDYGSISHIFPQDNTCIMNLTKSYRSTMEITEFSKALLKKKATDEFVGRSGDEPLVLGFPKEEDIRERILGDIEVYKGRGYKSIGIITRTKKEANELYGCLKDKVQVRAIISEEEEYMNDAVIIPSYLAKGLEFDVVLIYNAGNENYSCEEERLLFYTACTRALHVLCVYYSGECSPLLRKLPNTGKASL